MDRLCQVKANSQHCIIYINFFSIADKYSIGLIKIKETLDEAISDKNNLGEELKKEIEDIKAKQIEEIKEAAKKKKKKLKEEDLLIAPKFTEDMLIKLYAHKLKGQTYRNKGFVLDAFPRTFTNASGLFKEETVPNKVILIEAEDELLNARAKAIPEEKRKGTHYEPKEMKRRLAEYKQRHDGSQGFPPLIAFFEERGIEVLKINAATPEEENLSAIQQYIEKVKQFIIIGWRSDFI